MSEHEYFRQALANFTFEAASGGAIRHLADRGYTAEEISKRLDWHTPFERIQAAIWNHFLDTGVLLRDEPGTGKKREAFEFVAEYDQYGRRTFRRVTIQESGEEVIAWRESAFRRGIDGELLPFLIRHCRANGEASAYISCDFGLRMEREPERFSEALQLLERPEREYILGLPWENQVVYHRLDERMRRIAAGLYRKGEYSGQCYFVEEKERVEICM